MLGAEETAARMRRMEERIILLGTRGADDARSVPLMERMAYYAVPGVGIAVIQDGVIADARGYGVRQACTADAVTPGTLFQAASISKPVTVLGALRLVERGLLDLDADINDTLTTWKVPANADWQPRITLRQLASHTAGMTVHGFPGYPRDQAAPTLVQVLDGAPPANSAPVRVDTLPGTQFRYAGGGTSIIQQLMTDVTGEPFPALMRALVLDPLGMTASGYRQPLPEDRWPEAATGHRTGGGPVAGRWHVYPEMAAAGLWTTPSDLARFAIGVQHAFAGTPGSIVSQEMARAMLTPQMEMPGRLDHFTHIGLGPFLVANGTRRFGHSGGNEGFRCLLVADIEGGAGAVVMTSSDEGMPLVEEILNAIAREFAWPGYLPAQRKPTTNPTTILDRYAGTYHLRPGFMLTVTRDGDALRIQPTGQAPLRFVPESDTTFFSDAVDAKLTFVTADGGAVASVCFQQDGREIAGDRS